MTHAHLIPLLYKVPVVVLPALTHVLSRMSEDRPLRTDGSTLTRIVEPNVGIGIANRPPAR